MEQKDSKNIKALDKKRKKSSSYNVYNSSDEGYSSSDTEQDYSDEEYRHSDTKQNSSNKEYVHLGTEQDSSDEEYYPTEDYKDIKTTETKRLEVKLFANQQLRLINYGSEENTANQSFRLLEINTGSKPFKQNLIEFLQKAKDDEHVKGRIQIIDKEIADYKTKTVKYAEKKNLKTHKASLQDYFKDFGKFIYLKPQQNGNQKEYIFERAYSNQAELVRLLNKYFVPLYDEIVKNKRKSSQVKQGKKEKEQEDELKEPKADSFGQLFLNTALIFIHRIAQATTLNDDRGEHYVNGILNKILELSKKKLLKFTTEDLDFKKSGFQGVLTQYLFDLKNHVNGEKNKQEISYAPKLSDDKTDESVTKIFLSKTITFLTKGRDHYIGEEVFSSTKKFQEGLADLQGKQSKFKKVTYKEWLEKGKTLAKDELLTLSSQDGNFNIYDKDSNKMICAIRKSAISENDVNNMNNKFAELSQRDYNNINLYGSHRHIQNRKSSTDAKSHGMACNLGFLSPHYASTISSSEITLHIPNLYLGLEKTIVATEKILQEISPKGFEVEKERMRPFRKLFLPNVHITPCAMINFNKQTSIHLDNNHKTDDHSGILTPLTVFYGKKGRSYNGGETVLADYCLGVDVCQGDVVVADFEHIYHYNLPFILKNKEEPQQNSSTEKNKEEVQQNSSTNKKKNVDINNSSVFRMSVVPFSHSSLTNRKKIEYKEASTDEESKVDQKSLKNSKFSESPNFSALLKDFANKKTNKIKKEKSKKLYSETTSKESFNENENENNNNAKSKTNTNYQANFMNVADKEEIDKQPVVMPNTISQIKSTKDSGADESFKNEGERVYENVHDRDRALKKDEVSFKNGNWYNILVENPSITQPNVKSKDNTF